MEHPIFVDDENMTLTTHHHEDIDYDDYNKPNVSKANEREFKSPSITEKETTSILRLGQKTKQDMLAALYRHLNVTGNL